MPTDTVNYTMNKYFLGLGRRESFENPSESSWFQAGPTKHGNRLQAGLAATGNRQLDGVELVLATCDSSDGTALNNPMASSQLKYLYLQGLIMPVEDRKGKHIIEDYDG